MVDNENKFIGNLVAPVAPDLSGAPGKASGIGTMPKPENSTSQDAAQPAPVNIQSAGANNQSSESLSKADRDRLDKEELARKLADGVIGIDEQISRMEAARKEVEPETEEQRKKRERRERSSKIIGAIGDGISAMSNLYFTSQYSPHINQRSNSLLTKLGERIAQNKKEREANAEKYLNFSLKLGDLKNQRAATLREIEAAHEAQKIARQQADIAAKQHEWKALLQPDIQREQKGKADEAGSKAEVAATKAKYAEDHEKGDLALNEAKIATEKSKQNANNASATLSRTRSAKENEKEFRAKDRNGRWHRFRNEKAATLFAKQEGSIVYVDIEESVAEKDSDGNVRKTTEKRKEIGYPGDGSAGTMPGVSGP